jgi:MFS family permease
MPAPAVQHRQAAFAIFACMNAIYFFAYFHRIAVPGTIFDELQSAFRVSASAITALGAIYLYIYGGMQLFAGMLNDRLGAVRVIVIGGLLLCVGAIAFPLATTIPFLYVARGLVGLGSSLIFLSVIKAVDMLYGPRLFSQLLSVTVFLGCVGGLAGTFPFERAVSQWGWRGSMLGAGILCSLALIVAMLLFRKTRDVMQYASRTSPLVVKAILANRSTWPLLVVLPLTFSIYFLLQATIGKKFLLDYCGMSSSLAASITFIMMLVSMAAALAGGFLPRLISDQRKPLMIAAVICVISGCGLLLVLLHLGINSTGWFLLAYILLALSMIASPLGSTLMKELNPPEAVGTSIGVSNGMCYVAVALLTTVAGSVMDRFRDAAVTTATAIIYPREAYAVTLLICIALALIALVSAFFLRETRGRNVFAAEEAAPVPTP